MNSLDRSLHKLAEPTLTISIVDLPKIIWQRRSVVLISTLGALCIAILACVFIPPTYEASSIVSGQIGASPQNDPTNRANIPTALVEQTLNSQAQIMLSEEVLRRAIRVENPKLLLFPQLTQESAADPKTPENLAFLAVSKALTVRPEPNSNLLRVSYRNKDPVVAANFVRTLVKTFIDRNLELERDTDAVAFFKKLKEKYDQESSVASAALSSFSNQAKAFSIEEQRKLTLNRWNSIKAALALTRGSIAEKESQTEALSAELARLRPRALESKQLGPLGWPDKGASQKDPDDHRQFASDPPLLLMRVYQETAQILVRLRSELAGARALESQQEKELAKVDDELRLLSVNEAEFERLKREVEQIRQRGDLYSRKMSEQQLDADLNANRFSSIRVVQAATIPFEPIFPKPHLLIPIGLVIGLVIGAGLAILLHSIGPEEKRTKKFHLPSLASLGKYIPNIW